MTGVLRSGWGGISADDPDRDQNAAALRSWEEGAFEAAEAKRVFLEVMGPRREAEAAADRPKKRSRFL